MGFFQKIGLVEQIEPTYDYSITEEAAVSDEIEVSTEDVSGEDMVKSIYEQNDLGDYSQSIYKVEELISSLPKEMPTDTKRKTVLSILGSFGLTTDMVVEDATSRLKILQGAKDHMMNSADVEISNAETEIESYKQKIEENEKVIAEKQAYKEKTDVDLGNEITKINTLVNFVLPESEEDKK